ncbi:ATP-binding protein [Embleya sp. NPDC005575]|uniref:ATP-binding protein n=1 Tax=Embleya sp. NPDC005575 TaxID=3156892 RepID=UPI0033B7E0B4
MNDDRHRQQLEPVRATDADREPGGLRCPIRPQALPDESVAVYAAPAEAIHVGRVRRWACQLCVDWGIDEDGRDAVRAITSGLAGNAVEHSGSADMTVVLSCDASSVWVEVIDRGRWRFTPTVGPQAMSEHGRGWDLVEGYATRSGVRRGAHGTCAWAEVRRSR